MNVAEVAEGELSHVAQGEPLAAGFGACVSSEDRAGGGMGRLKGCGAPAGERSAARGRLISVSTRSAPGPVRRASPPMTTSSILSPRVADLPVSASASDQQQLPYELAHRLQPLAGASGAALADVAGAVKALLERVRAFRFSLTQRQLRRAGRRTCSFCGLHRERPLSTAPMPWARPLSQCCRRADPLAGDRSEAADLSPRRRAGGLLRCTKPVPDWLAVLTW